MKYEIDHHEIKCSLHQLATDVLGLNFPEMNDPGVQTRSDSIEKVFMDWYENREEECETLTKHLVIAPRGTAKTALEGYALPGFMRLREGQMRIQQHPSGIGGLKVQSMMEYLDPSIDVGLMVDPVSSEDTQGMAWMEQSACLYGALKRGMERNGLLILVLSRWSRDDLVGWIFENEIRPAYEAKYGCTAPDDFKDDRTTWESFASLAGWSVNFSDVTDYPTIWTEGKLADLNQTTRGSQLYAPQLMGDVA